MHRRRLFPIWLILLFACHPAYSAEIHDAVQAGKLDAVKRLVAADPKSLNEAEVHGWTPLFLAASTGYPDMVRFLLSAGARVDAKDLDGDTALHEAAGNARKPVVELLLKHGADVHAINKAGMTPLHRVARDGFKDDHKAIVDLLLKAGANLEAKDGKGQTPVAVAAKERRKTMETYLREKAVTR